VRGDVVGLMSSLDWHRLAQTEEGESDVAVLGRAGSIPTWHWNRIRPS
jgi:hypothetical protein